jgi:hypothetical protein
MSPIIEKSIGVAGDAVHALKASPLILALVLLQAFTLAGIAWSINQRAVFMNEERKMMFDERKMFVDIQRINTDLLAKCIVPKI